MLSLMIISEISILKEAPCGNKCDIIYGYNDQFNVNVSVCCNILKRTSWGVEVETTKQSEKF